MKAIIIENCEDCPLCHYSRQKAYCDSAAVVLKRESKESRYLGKIYTEPKIPNWCPLSNQTDRIMEFFLDNKIKIPQKLRELTLKEEGRSPIN